MEFSLAPGGRVLVPFRQQRLVGIVTELHDRAPKVAAKNVIEALGRCRRAGTDDGVAAAGKVDQRILPCTAG